ncbi:hypothetical protein Tco_0921002, partial [Tanacetum coccineum]
QMTDELRDFLETSLPKGQIQCLLRSRIGMVLVAFFGAGKDCQLQLSPKTAQYIGDKVELSEDKLEGLIEILGDEDKAK